MSAEIHRLAAAKQILDTLRVSRGRIVAIDPDGTILVEDGARDCVLACDFLRTSAGPAPRLSTGDEVIYIAGDSGERGCVLGLVERYSTVPEIPDNLHLEANRRIELRCGNGSVTMSNEGKIV
ncbi:MAG: hypothetical protein OEU25_07900, partial [Rhodospirillales bacterium]|nr:hypothetical protein [Rhodospirillales bacterium]